MNKNLTTLAARFSVLALAAAACAAQAGTLVINTDASDPAPKAAWEAMAKGFMAANPDVTVKINTFDHEGFKTSIRNFLTAEAPDIVTWYAGNRMAPFVNAGLFEDVSDVWAKEGLNDKLKSAAASMTQKGKQWGIPYTYYQWGIYYRKDIFADVYEKEYKERFEEAGLTYFYTLIDDVVARIMKSEGGFVWACKNYDGDVMSDMVSTAFGSLAMMTSVLVSPDGNYEYEAAHGTVTRHYYKYLKGEATSTNPMATIFAWSGALKKRGELDSLPALVRFGEALEAASLQTLNDGIMTKDLCGLAEGITPTQVNSEEFIQAIRTRLEAKLA